MSNLLTPVLSTSNSLAPSSGERAGVSSHKNRHTTFSAQPSTDSAYFFLAADLAATAALFFFDALLALTCFCVDFFWFDFGDLSPICFYFYGLTRLRHVSFSAGISQNARTMRECKQPFLKSYPNHELADCRCEFNLELPHVGSYGIKI
jgi:hypothetical protein